VSRQREPLSSLAKGYGETRPVVPNDSDEHRAQNRRVDFTIVSRQ
jgi:chemotaxis protein MotB